MARDRRRAKQRRERQAKASGGGRARPRSDGSSAQPDAPEQENPLHEHEPAELASGEVDIAEAHVALGRPELAGDAGQDPDALSGAGEAEVEGDEATFEALEDRVDEAEAIFEGRSPGNGHADRGEEVVRERTAVAAPRQREGNKLANFLRGSWRELQRVQWPDRRQVGQATAVVIGFVFIAGAFLGLMDFLASKIVEFIV